MDLCDIYNHNKTKHCRAPIEAIYEKLNCGLHRKDLIEILIEQKVLSEKIRNEIIYDSDPETRKLAAGII